MTNQLLYNIECERRLRVGVIGCGGHAYRNILPAFQFAPVELAALCDLDEARARQCARVFGGAQVYTDYRQMLEAETLDAVFVILPADAAGRPRYPALACEVMQAGVHVWIEKPPAASVAEVRAMQEMSARSGKFVGVGFKKMFAPANLKAREFSRSAEFGRVTSIAARYPQSLPEKAERGDSRKMAGFLDHIVHPFAVLRLFGGDLESLRFERCGHNGASVSTLTFASGAIGSLLLGAGQSGLSPLERTEIIGEGANVVVENNLRVTCYGAGSPRGGYGRSPSWYDVDGPGATFFEPEFSLGNLHNKGLFLLGYAPEISSFCHAVLENRAPQKGNLDDALALMQIYEAYQQGSEGELLRLAKP